MESAAELKSVAAMPPPFESNENESNGNSSSYSINQHEQRSRDVDDDNINDGKDVIDNNSIKSSQSGVGDECTARYIIVFLEPYEAHIFFKDVR